MLVSDLINSVKENFYGNVPNKNEIISSLNRIIGEVNTSSQQTKTINNIFEGEWDKTVSEMTETIISELTETTIGDMTELLSGYEYDSTDFILTLTRNVQMITKVYVDDIKYQNYDLQRLRQRPSDYIYTAIGNKIYFGTDVSQKDLLLVVKVLFDKITSSDTEYTSMPESAYQMLVSGAIMILSLRPKYKDPDMYRENKDIYLNLRSDFTYLVARFTPVKQNTRKHDF